MELFVLFPHASPGLSTVLLLSHSLCHDEPHVPTQVQEAQDKATPEEQAKEGSRRITKFSLELRINAIEVCEKSSHPLIN